MINEAQVVLAGYVAREPKYRTTNNGVSMTSLRVGYTPRRVDRETGEWADGASSFVTVICWRGLADNVATCVRKGEPVLVKGRLQVRPYDKDGVARLAVEIEASAVGHDLARGVARFQRSRPAAGETALGRQMGAAGDGPAAPLGAPPGLPGLAGMTGVPGMGAVPGMPAGEDQEEEGASALAAGAGGAGPAGGSGDGDEEVVTPAGLTVPF